MLELITIALLAFAAPDDTDGPRVPPPAMVPGDGQGGDDDPEPCGDDDDDDPIGGLDKDGRPKPLEVL